MDVGRGQGSGSVSGTSAHQNVLVGFSDSGLEKRNLIINWRTN